MAEDSVEKSNTSLSYADRFEKYAQDTGPFSPLAMREFDQIGMIELNILLHAGMNPTQSLLDFGCGEGRLAKAAIPFLSSGRYIGTDISHTMLERAKRVIQSANLRGEFLHQPTETFPTIGIVDYIAAYSVFPHLEIEDTYRYLLSSRKISRIGTILVASLLTFDSEYAQEVFSNEQKVNIENRFGRVRNVVMAKEQFEHVAKLAGWEVFRWIGANETLASMNPRMRFQSAPLGQTVALLNFVKK